MVKTILRFLSKLSKLGVICLVVIIWIYLISSLVHLITFLIKIWPRSFKQFSFCQLLNLLLPPFHNFLKRNLILFIAFYLIHTHTTSYIERIYSCFDSFHIMHSFLHKFHYRINGFVIYGLFLMFLTIF